jgi:hypothetical protein
MKNACQENVQDQRLERPGSERRAAYHAPQIVEFGDVRELTQGNSGTSTELNGMPHARM